jgi:Spy/CpxP family protein refolding chaperone
MMPSSWPQRAVLLAVAFFPLGGFATDTDDAAYMAVITERADRIVAELELTDAAQQLRARDLIAGQYRALRDIHAQRDAKLSEVQGGDPTVAAAFTKAAHSQAREELDTLHRRFVAQLAAELSPEQVDQVKDGLTYGVVPITYHRYCQLLPDMSGELRRAIHANLLEAREYAMDAGSSDEKHAWFGRYKGRINNLISAAGFDLKQAEKSLAERESQRKNEGR